MEENEQHDPALTVLHQAVTGRRRRKRRWLPLIIPYALFLFLTWPLRCLYRCIKSAARDKRVVPGPSLLPLHRAHALSTLTITPPADSSLLALPYELRHKIWKYAIGGKIFHIQLQLSKLPGSRFKPLVPHYMTYRNQTNGPKWRWHNTGLLYVCRQAYQESIAVLYQENFFDLSQTRYQCSWAALDIFAGVIPSSRRNILRRLKLHLQSTCESNHHFLSHYDPVSRQWSEVPGFSGLQHLILVINSVYLLDGLFPAKGQPKTLATLGSKLPSLVRLEIMIRGPLYGMIGTLQDLIKEAVNGEDGWSVQVWKGLEFCWGLTFLKSSNVSAAHVPGHWRTFGREKTDLLGGVCSLEDSDIEWVDAKSLLGI